MIGDVFNSSLMFNRSLSQFHYFVNPIKTDGGKDTAEDIMGALKVTLSNLSWRPSATKVLIVFLN